MRVCLCVNAFVFVCLNVLVCVYVNARDYACANGVNALICQCPIVFVRQYISMFNKVIQGTFSLQILPLFRSKTLRNHGIFKTSKQLFQRRFYLSVSPDCKMCVRVTNTGTCSKNRG